MTKPLRIALKVWLFLIVLTAGIWLNSILVANNDSIYANIFISLLFIGVLAVIIFWEKLTG